MRHKANQTETTFQHSGARGHREEFTESANAARTTSAHSAKSSRRLQRVANEM